MDFGEWLKNRKADNMAITGEVEKKPDVVVTVEKEVVKPEEEVENKMDTEESVEAANIFSLASLISMRIAKHIFTSKDLNKECAESLIKLTDELKKKLEELK